MRFLRKRYKDPITGSDFRLLHVGEVQLTFRPIAQPGVAAGAASSTNGAGTGGGQSRNDSTSPSPLVSPSQMGATGGEFGGGPIMGVASTSEKQSFHVFNDGDHYKDWLFVYSPVLDRCGLFTRPFDGIQPSGNCGVPIAPVPMPADAGSGPAPGVPIPPSTNK